MVNKVKSNALAILTYHSLDSSGSVISVSPQDFAWQMSCLADLGVKGISLREATAYRESAGKWPEQSVVLTFDDGYANFYENGLPVLQKHGFKGTVFVVSGYAGEQNRWETLPTMRSQNLLSWQQIKELAKAGIEIGAHTQTHRDLSKLSPSDVEVEIVASRREIEHRVGQPVDSFAYPFGATNRTSIAIAAREFRASCTTVLRRASGQTLSNLPRIDMYYISKPVVLERLVNGQLDEYLAVRRWARRARQALMSSRWNLY